MKFTMPDKPRAVRDVVASFPAFVAVDAEGLCCAARFLLIEPGTGGYYPLHAVHTLDKADALALAQGAERLPTPQEREAAQVGSMMGWDVPGADPANYGEG